MLPKTNQVCAIATPAKRQRTITDVTDKSKQESFAKLMAIAYELALKPNLPLTAFNFAIKALRRSNVNIIKGYLVFFSFFISSCFIH